MKTLPLAHDERLALAAYAPPLRAERQPDRGTVLHALGGPAAVMAAVDRKAAADLISSAADDWSGSFDIHLGVYTSE